MMEYEVLKLIWWVLIGVLLIGFAITDGFDMGAGALLPFLGKTDSERRVIINTVGPHWDGNQVWLITAGGAIFAAWPVVYATAFSGFYWAMLLTLFALFFRPVGFDYRSKIDDPRWRRAWDWGLFAGGAVPPIIFGVAFGNLLQGVPFHLDEVMRSYYTGSFWQLLNPFALLAGVLSLLMIVSHGAVWLMMKADKVVAERARAVAVLAGFGVLVLFALAGLWVAFGLDGFRVTAMPDHNADINPLNKEVITATGAWLDNYSRYPWMLVAPVLGLAGALGVALAAMRRSGGWGFLASSLMLAGIIMTAGFSLFPFVMPSSTVAASSLTVWDVTSSHKTLQIMFVVCLIFVPIVLAYTIWSYVKMWGRVEVDYIEKNSTSSY
ncbi:cytochrome d ubiquinol oxidase subunit II [Marinobacteraceae bacterium S3BR75-40.1]